MKYGEYKYNIKLIPKTENFPWTNAMMVLEHTISYHQFCKTLLGRYIVVYLYVVYGTLLLVEYVFIKD